MSWVGVDSDGYVFKCPNCGYGFTAERQFMFWVVVEDNPLIIK